MHRTIAEFYGHADALDTEGVCLCLDEDVELQFSNSPLIKGRQQVREVFSQFYGTIKSMKHDFVSEWETSGTTLLESRVTYTRGNGTVLSVPAFSVVELHREKISSVRIFVDLSHL
ncbi:nuclear transport factor 2 family protein [Pseudomaricurvus alkylphenolicus]|uniref:nuclear transport factor 2 family protein n=1 Tax=Pseudomaricurvus alkylphenolicus TaxID=1306991 RepID=UPI00141FD0FD|nr:nuclear transport factor 2 family protein [Pseudomaricurvus alkylphenolicus]NIB40812.1 nuclear transport factor 2 family protein [Pseudomaricurvus alkylphenolicus]